DVQLPGMDGLELLERLLKISPTTFVLLITAFATVESAVEAFQRGAHDYLMKPILLHEVLSKIRRLLAYRELFRENQWLRRELRLHWRRPGPSGGVRARRLRDGLPGRDRRATAGHAGEAASRH